MRTPILVMLLASVMSLKVGANARESSDHAHVLKAGEWAPLQSAERRIVPGVAGVWISSGLQTELRDAVIAMDRAASTDCPSAQIVNSWVSTPDIQWGNKSGLIADFSLQTWVVERCGARADYRVLFAWPRAGKLNVSIRPVLGLKEYWGHPLVDSTIKQLVAEREGQRAAGEWEDLNVPIPPLWKLAFRRRDELSRTAIFEMLPEKETLKDWRSMITVQLLFGDVRPTPEELLNGARELRQELCGSDQESVILDRGATVLAGTVLLVCERVPKTDYAEVTLAKAIAGRSYLYYVHLGWRTSPGDRGTVLKAMDEKIVQGRKFLDSVRLCDSARELNGCESPFFL